MVDNEGSVQTKNKKKGLKPLSPQTNDDDNVEVQVPKLKPKKKIVNSGLTSPVPLEDNDAQNKPTPRRRKRSPSQGVDGNERLSLASQQTLTTPRKKKKKPKADKEDDSKSSITDPMEILRIQPDGQGSKMSLISTATTPRKKGGKKKKKKVKNVTEDDDYRESPWAEDLRAMKEDIITGDSQTGGDDGKESKGDKNKPDISFITVPVLRSQPLDKIFIETSNKFKGQRKSTMTRQRVEDTRTVEPVPVTRRTTIDFAVGTHKVFQVVTLFLHGLTAGLALWQLVTVLVLSSFSNDDFLEHYYGVSLPLQSSYYFLLVMCSVAVCDRFDIGNPTPRFVLRAVTLQNGAVSIVLCLAALILNIVAIRYDDRMYLFKEFSDLYSDNNMKSDEVNTFRGINTARSVLIILSWLVLSITPNSDRLAKNLRSGETGLEKEHELTGVSSA